MINRAKEHFEDELCDALFVIEINDKENIMDRLFKTAEDASIMNYAPLLLMS